MHKNACSIITHFKSYKNKRYGRHWQLHCAVKLEETRKIYPVIDGERNLLTPPRVTTEIPFALNIFTDETFSQMSDGAFSLDAKSGNQSIYIQV